MDSRSYLISAEARSQALLAHDDSQSHLRIPIIDDSHNGATKSKRNFCRAMLAWPRRVVVAIGHALGLVFKLLFLIIALVLYALLLMPGFIRMIVYYFFSPDVVRGVMYGSKPRQRLDLYFPRHARDDVTYPVVVYVTGGAWTIGYKAWGALLARRLSEQGVLVACLDYRNFPQGDALDMLEDVNTGISWVLSRIHRFGGDPDSVTLVGQSAGGHLAGLALIKQAEQAMRGYPALGASPAWSPACLKAFVGVSGAYDLAALAEHLHRRGLYRNVFDRIMTLSTDTNDPSVTAADRGFRSDWLNGSTNGGLLTCGLDGRLGLNGLRSSGCRLASLGPEGYCCQMDPKICGQDAVGSDDDCGCNGGCNGDCNGDCDGSNGSGGATHDASGCKGGARPAFEALSPLQAARRLPPGAAGMLPYVLLIHGTADKTVPAEGSAQLCEALQSSGAPSCRCLLIPGKTHTAFLLEDPMRGGRDLLMDTVLGAVKGSGDSENHVYGTLCPGFLCDMAGWVCPF